MELFHAFGLDIRILLAQLINFAVLIYVLYRFLYTPLFALIEKREKTIAEGVQRAEASEQLHGEAKKEAEKVILEARREAKEIIAEAHRVAKESREATLERAKEEASAIILSAKKQSEEEKKSYVTRLRGEIAELVVLASEKIVGKKWDASADKEFIEETVSGMSKTVS